MKLVYINRTPRQIFDTLLKRGMLPFNSEAKKEYFEKYPYDGMSINALNLFPMDIPMEVEKNEINDGFAVAELSYTFSVPDTFIGAIKHEQAHSTTDSYSMSGYDFTQMFFDIDHLAEFYPKEGVVFWSDLDDATDSKFTWVTNKRNIITCYQDGYNAVLEITSWRHNYEAASPRLVAHILEKLEELTEWD